MQYQSGLLDGFIAGIGFIPARYGATPNRKLSSDRLGYGCDHSVSGRAHHRGMRRSATVVLSAVLLLGLAAPGAPASQAAHNNGDLRIEAPDIYYTQISDPTRVAMPVRVDTGGAAVRGVTLTVDAADVQGTVRLYAKRACAQGAGYVFTCRLGSGRLRYDLVDLVVLGADKAAEPGTHGTVRFTATASDGIDASDPRMVSPSKVHGLLVVSDSSIAKAHGRLAALIDSSKPIDEVGHSITIYRRP
jgi:hypothetical protein